MSEDRTQAPSKRRRDEARAQGVVARSSELTAAVGLLAAVTLLGGWGGSLTSGLLDLVRAPLLAPTAPDGDAVTAMIRAAAFRILLPLAGLLGGVVVAMVAAHQAQVGGLWVPGLIAPDLDRLRPSSGGDWVSRAARGVWGIAKAAVVVAVVALSIRGEFGAMSTLARMETRDLALSCGTLLKTLAYTVGLGTLVLGLVDYFLAHRRVEAMLFVTPDQQREDQKAVDGDPAVRSRRNRLSRSWRSDPSDLLDGAALLLTGPAGLTVVLGGEGPPGKIVVRGSARGASGAALRRSAGRAGLPAVESPALAQHFAAASARNRALPEDLRRSLAAIWPA